MRASHVNDSQHLRARAAEMRASSKELIDNNTAAVIMRLADLYDRLADRAETRGNRVSLPEEAKPKKPTRQSALRCLAFDGYATLSSTGRSQRNQPMLPELLRRPQD
jgi:hypothetical protein